MHFLEIELEKPNVDELFISASHASNLKVEAEKKSPVDIIIAAGWSSSRVGMALLRLASEWDGAEKRPRMSETDYILLRSKLKSLTNVLAQVVAHMGKRGMDSPERNAGPIVGYWLDQTCHGCHGLKFLTIRDTPVLSGMRCRTCHGSGKGEVPAGGQGKDVLNWMDACVGAARASLKARLRR